MPADDAVATPQPVLDIEQVHRAALALHQTRALAVQLGHHLVGVAAEEEGVGVVPVGGDDLVSLLVKREEPGGDRFLPAIEMEVTTDLPLPEAALRGILEEADGVHLPIEIERRLGIEVLGFGSVPRRGRASWSLLRLALLQLRLRDRRLATTAFSSGSGPSLSPCARLSRLRRIAPVVASRIRCSCHGVARGSRRPRRPVIRGIVPYRPRRSWRYADLTTWTARLVPAAHDVRGYR